MDYILNCKKCIYLKDFHCEIHDIPVSEEEASHCYCEFAATKFYEEELNKGGSV